MTIKQLKKILLIGLIILLVIGVVVYAFFFADWSSSTTVDYETAKSTGGYELLKADLVSTAKCKDSQAVTIADTFFEKIGIQKYQSIVVGGRLGGYTITADGYNFDCAIVAGTLRTAYIGNVAVFINTKEGGTALPTALEYTYTQYQTLVKAFSRGSGISEDNAKEVYQKLTIAGFNSFSDIKKGKLKALNLSGISVKEGNAEYFITLNSDGSDISKIYAVCAAFDPLEVYNSNGNSAYSLKDVKVLSGARQGIANVMEYRFKSNLDMTVKFPNALINGDDSWLMVRNGDQIYLEVLAEVSDSKGNVKNREFSIMINASGNELIWVKMNGKQIYG